MMCQPSPAALHMELTFMCIRVQLIIDFSPGMQWDILI